MDNGGYKIRWLNTFLTKLADTCKNESAEEKNALLIMMILYPRDTKKWDREIKACNKLSR